ncbi:MAG: hypothetical protein ACERKD_02025 [Prolixibacteraceae bacterium]
MIQKYLFIIVLALPMFALSQTGKKANKPLYRDPVYDGAADPVVIWNEAAQSWFMYYTNRRANIADTDGVKWVHGTRIGIARSKDGGASWSYLDTCNIDYHVNAEYSHWAPEVIFHEGTFHMYLTYVPGIFADWRHPRWIVHLTSTDGINWNFESKLTLASEKVIDACVAQLPDGSWRMWYNNEAEGKTMYYADSPDLYEWTDQGKALGSFRGEGPKVFNWNKQWWMIIDAWKGLAAYQTTDFIHWEKQEEHLLQQPGSGEDDQVMGGHPDVVVQGNKAYLFYFTHPGRRAEIPDSAMTEKRRSSIQVTELHLKDGKLTCERDHSTFINLQPEIK